MESAGYAFTLLLWGASIAVFTVGVIAAVVVPRWRRRIIAGLEQAEQDQEGPCPSRARSVGDERGTTGNHGAWVPGPRSASCLVRPDPGTWSSKPVVGMTQSLRLRRPPLSSAAKGRLMSGQGLMRDPLTAADRLLIFLKIIVAVIVLPVALMWAAALLFYVLVGTA